MFGIWIASGKEKRKSLKVLTKNKTMCILFSFHNFYFSLGSNLHYVKKGKKKKEEETD